MKQKLKQLLAKEAAIQLSTVNGESAPETRAMINLHNKEIAPHLQEFFVHTSLTNQYFV
jgi:general stress protein 26